MVHICFDKPQLKIGTGEPDMTTISEQNAIITTYCAACGHSRKKNENGMWVHEFNGREECPDVYEMLVECQSENASLRARVEELEKRNGEMDCEVEDYIALHNTDNEKTARLNRRVAELEGALQEIQHDAITASNCADSVVMFCKQALATGAGGEGNVE